ncbi:hypothetical protein LQV05_000162 [Cryptococcus neoformans]|nr:pre-mRNA cleavage complex 2 protein Pcf11 [Cryptococcus neoformans var. grubii c45]OXB39990.1 pre-mRNA cleavage complex 2 protein Pcf11 [Cryptococcus neoformans var. grubii]OXC66557.1 pre-mRNA cleavage complex 2 protein Pcf11 [Cryptococcus neoformans var. grubii MW-RSA852]UOH79172.1 hypothetical protein LQV05_000162 [Cryptococcus neoformans]
MAYQAYPAYQQAPYYPPPPVQPTTDVFRRQYADRLRALTFNSRPIIQDLSMLAMAARDRNDWNGMQAVVEEIELAVLRALPQQKLPLLYLLDSISKNVGPPYTTRLLQAIVPRLYIKTYREVDGVTKTKMEEMIGLWRTGGPGGSELYGSHVREQVERELFGSAGIQNFKAPNRQQVQVLLNAALDNKRREVAMRPGDVVLGRQLNALLGIGELLSTTNVQPQELSMIVEQLKSMAPPSVAPTPTQASVTPPWGPTPSVNDSTPSNLPPFPPKLPAVNGNRYTNAALPPFPSNIPTPLETISTAPMTSSQTPISGNQRSSTPVMAPASLAPVPSIVPSVPSLPVDVARILQTLNKSGIGSQPQTPDVERGTPGPNMVPTTEAYEDMILRLDIKLQSIDLNAHHKLSFAHLSHRCQQCGMRFPSANAAFDAHMDWHFRRNKKERESGGRGAHRRWLPRVEQWVNDAITLPSTAASSSQTEKATVSAERLAQLRQKWVKVPQDSKKAASVCPVCKEAFRAEWSDSEEEWIWKNALAINGIFYHATCRAEQTSALKRLKAADPNRRTSSSASPRTTPSNEGLKPEAQKRKVEGMDVEHEEGSKRVKVEDIVDDI